MSSTNKTTNYELSQYVGSDKPTYLGDYNSDMLKIDTQMKTNATGISGAVATANTANATANSALSTANTAQTTATTAQTTANTANTTANTALEKSLQNESDILKFNLTDIQDLTLTSQAGGQITQFTGSPLKIATNTDKSIFKIYGSFELTGLSNPPTPQFYIKTGDTGLRPSASYNISPIGTKILYTTGGGTTAVAPLYMRVNTDGTIDILIDSISNMTGCRCIIFPCLYFNADFGD